MSVVPSPRSARLVALLVAGLFLTDSTVSVATGTNDACGLLKTREIEKELRAENVDGPNESVLSDTCEWSIAADEFVPSRTVYVVIETERPIGNFNGIKDRYDGKSVVGIRQAITYEADRSIGFYALRKPGVVAVEIAYDVDINLAELPPPPPEDPPAGVGAVIELGLKAVRRFVQGR